MTVTARQLNRATLERQCLLRRAPVDVVGAVHRVMALQAQEPASPYVALWNRVADFDPSSLDAAFADHSIVKTTLMRATLHAVDATDYPRFHEAMQRTLRATRLWDPRFTKAGLSIPATDALLYDAVAFTAEPRLNGEVEAWIDERFGELPKPGPWWAMRTFGPFVHHPTGGPWSFGPRPRYMAAPAQDRPGDPHASLQWLVRRYLAAFGPASVKDIAQFAMLYRPPLREAVDALRDTLEQLEGPDGSDLLDVPGGALPPDDAPAPPRLLGMWDSVLLAYADRSRIVPADYRRLVTRTNGDVLPTLLVDGYVAGVWRPVADGIEATAFERLAAETWAGLDDEARALRGFLADREPTIYRRYARWWTDLPSAEVRLLGV